MLNMKVNMGVFISKLDVTQLTPHSVMYADRVNLVYVADPHQRASGTKCAQRSPAVPQPSGPGCGAATGIDTSCYLRVGRAFQLWVSVMILSPA